MSKTPIHMRFFDAAVERAIEAYRMSIDGGERPAGWQARPDHAAAMRAAIDAAFALHTTP